MILDFKIQQDEFGFFVIAYRLIGGVELQYQTCTAISAILKLSPKDYKEYIFNVYHSDEESKNDKMHFSLYEDALKCQQGLRELIPIGLETGNIFLAR
jgi:hypothetical protein